MLNSSLPVGSHKMPLEMSGSSIINDRRRSDHAQASISKLIIYFDPKPLTREPFTQWLSTKLQDFHVLATSDADAVSRMGRRTDVLSLVLINVGAMKVSEPGVMDRITQFRDEIPGVPMAVITDFDDHEAVVAALGCGLRGFIPTSMAGTVVLEVVRLICAGGTYAPVNSIVAGMVNASLPDQRLKDDAIVPVRTPQVEGFTPRQLEILNCLRRGLANKLIAHELSMRESTVKVHVRNIMKKLRATNRTQVVSMTWDLLDTAQSNCSLANASISSVQMIP